MVFHDHGLHVLDRFLKPGFRHCLAVVSDGRYWISVDGRDGKPVVEVVAGADYDLVTFYRGEGFTVVETEVGPLPIRAPMVLSNCVGMVKAVLAIRAPHRVTPYQLFKHLEKQHVAARQIELCACKARGKEANQSHRWRWRGAAES